ncbi:unnamed protein product [Phytomonas sp. Hart1]|nr:unnamed protein product [Phytomonas sp. Hart1]|eukprot:CCW70967.1 unnamed protein product [Phytomonas sp. isolate Hart1]
MILRPYMRHIWSATTARQGGIRSAFALISAHVSCRQVASKSTESDGSAAKGNFFAFFDIPKQPMVDLVDLQKRYYALQSRVHPDQAAVMSSLDQSQVNDATDISVYANSAYETLRNPFRRCKYLYRILLAQEYKGGEPLTPEEEDDLLVEDDKRNMMHSGKATSEELNEEFMIELMAMNELIFSSDLDDSSARARLEVLQYDLKERNADYFDKAKESWYAEDTVNFKRLVQEWTYIHNALAHLKERL